MGFVPGATLACALLYGTPVYAADAGATPSALPMW